MSCKGAARSSSRSRISASARSSNSDASRRCWKGGVRSHKKRARDLKGTAQAQAYFAGQVEYLPNAANELEFRPAAFREAELALPGDWPPGMGPPACSTTPEIETNNCGVVHVIHT